MTWNEREALGARQELRVIGAVASGTDTQREVAAAAGLPVSAANRYLLRLVEAGVLACTREGRFLRYRIT